MKYLELLLLVYFIFWCIAIFLANGRYVSPSVCFFTSFFVMLLLATLFQDYFEFNIEYKTFELMSIAGCLFLSVEFVYRGLANLCQKGRYISVRFYSKRKKTANVNPKKNNEINIQPLIQIAIIIYMFVFFILAILFVFINSSAGNWNERMQLIRNAMNLRLGTLKLRFLLSQIAKIASALSLVCSYIMLYNVINCGKSIKSQWVYILLDILFALSNTIFGGGRQAAVEIVLYVIILTILLNLERGKIFRLWKVIIVAIPLILCLGLMFTVTASFVGRSQDTSDPILYMVRYFCGGFYFLNSFINKPATSQYWGQLSFSNIYSKLAILGLVPTSDVTTYHSFGKYGNTVTLFGRWYEDFGTSGVYIMTCLVAFFFSWLFYSKVLKRTKKESGLNKIIYAKLIISLVWAGYDDRIYSLISFGTLVTIFLIVIVYWFLAYFNRRYKITSS